MVRVVLWNLLNGKVDYFDRFVINSVKYMYKSSNSVPLFAPSDLSRKIHNVVLRILCTQEYTLSGSFIQSYIIQIVFKLYMIIALDNSQCGKNDR